MRGFGSLPGDMQQFARLAGLGVLPGWGTGKPYRLGADPAIGFSPNFVMLAASFTDIVSRYSACSISQAAAVAGIAAIKAKGTTAGGFTSDEVALIKTWMLPQYFVDPCAGKPAPTGTPGPPVTTPTMAWLSTPITIGGQRVPVWGLLLAGGLLVLVLKKAM